MSRYLDHSIQVRHRIHFCERKMGFPTLLGSLGHPDFSSESGLHSGIPCKLQEDPGDRIRSSLMACEQKRTACTVINGMSSEQKG